jgi:hypothetical protein
MKERFYDLPIGRSTAIDSPSDVTDLSARSRATFADAVLELGAPK